MFGKGTFLDRKTRIEGLFWRDLFPSIYFIVSKKKKALETYPAQINALVQFTFFLSLYLLMEGRTISNTPKATCARPNPTTPAPSIVPDNIVAPTPVTAAPNPVTIQLVVVGFILITPLHLFFPVNTGTFRISKTIFRTLHKWL